MKVMHVHAQRVYTCVSPMDVVLMHWQNIWQKANKGWEDLFEIFEMIQHIMTVAGIGGY